MDLRLDKTTILRAKDKMPTLREKYELALLGAKIVVEDEQDNKDASGTAVVNSYLRELYELKVLAADYMGLIAAKNIISNDEYERIYRYNIIAQLNKLRNKSDKDVQIAISAITTDYDLFCKMLYTEIDNELSRRNDIFMRLNRDIEASITPENVQKLADAQKNILAQAKEKHE